MADKFYTPKEATTPTANTDPSLVQRQQALATEDAQRRIRRDLESIKSSIVSTDDSFAPIRQTVLAAPNAKGLPSCFVASGADVDISGLSASSPLVLTWANGFNTPMNYRSIISADPSTAWVGLPLYSTPFCYVENDGSGNLTYGSSIYNPVYGDEFYGYKAGAILASFNGAIGATTFTGAYSEVWTLANGAAISNSVQFNGANTLYCAGSDDYAQCLMPDLSGKYTLEGFFYPTDSTRAAAQALISSSAAYAGIMVTLTTAGKLCLYVSSNGSSWNIANGLTGSTVLTDNAWAHIGIVFNGATYKVYLNGTCETGCTATSSSSVYVPTGPNPLYVRLGCWSDGTSNDFYGYISNFRFTNNARYNANFTAPSTAFSVEELHYFNKYDMTMYKGDPSAWVKTFRLFTHEAATDASAVTAVYPYQMHGKGSTGRFAIAAGTSYTKNHWLGHDDFSFKILATQYAGGYLVEPISFFDNSSFLTFHISGGNKKRNTLGMRTGAYATIPNLAASGYLQAAEAEIQYWRNF